MPESVSGAGVAQRHQGGRDRSARQASHGARGQASANKKSPAEPNLSSLSDFEGPGSRKSNPAYHSRPPFFTARIFPRTSRLAMASNQRLHRSPGGVRENIGLS